MGIGQFVSSPVVLMNESLASECHRRGLLPKECLSLRHLVASDVNAMHIWKQTLFCGLTSPSDTVRQQAQFWETVYVSTATNDGCWKMDVTRQKQDVTKCILGRWWSTDS
jgi:hypothetical protein